MVHVKATPTVYIRRLQTMSTVFIFYEIWIAILSFTGVMYESVPHMSVPLPPFSLKSLTQRSRSTPHAAVPWRSRTSWLSSTVCRTDIFYSSAG